MDASRRRTWVGVALAVGVVYLLIGRVFAVPTGHVRLWRLAAWVTSGGVFAAHIWYEQSVVRNAPRQAAVHVAIAAAIGAFGLAMAGMLHSLSTTSAIRPTWLFALVALPVITGVPAFVVALVAGTVVPRILRSRSHA